MRTKHALRALSALAQESRLAVFKLLVRHGNQGLAAGDMSKRLNIPAATLSFHLSQLNHAKLVTSEKNGRSIIYRANFERMQGLLSYLLERCSETLEEQDTLNNNSSDDSIEPNN